MRTPHPVHAVHAAVLLAPIIAQSPPVQWAPAGKLHLPPLPTDATALATGDVDGDGNVDLLIGVDGQTQLRRNTGSAIFVDATGRLPVRGGDTHALALLDADGDGDLDLLTVTSGQVLRLDRNDGGGTFTEVVGAFSNVPAITTSVAVGDVDGDGDLDAFVGANQSWDLLYLNDGTGTFVDGTTGAQLPRRLLDTSCVALFDMDGDGDLDLFVGIRNGQNLLFANDGTGVFTEVMGHLPSANDAIAAIAVGDVDGDGDLDLFSADAQDRLWLNDGTGRFVDATAGRVPTRTDDTADLALVDLDRDGDLDAVLANRDGPDAVLRNDGGSYVDVSATAWAQRPGSSAAVASADLDGDGWPEVVFGTRGQPGPTDDRILLNARGMSFVDGVLPRIAEVSAFPLGVAAGDLDGDGDVFQACRGLLGRPSAVVLTNDGHGRFAQAAVAPPNPTGDLADVALADVDGDGDLDALLAGVRSLYLNDGSAGFTDATAGQMPAGLGGVAVAAGDVDGDGDVDAVIGVTDFFNGGQNRLVLNDGTGNFSDATQQLPALSDFTVAVLLEDFDGDGDLDLYVANGGVAGGFTDRYLRNDGTGTFTDVTASHLPPLSGTVRDAAACDVDGDGDLDVFCATGAPGAGAADRLLRNDGRGVFTDVSASRLPGTSANSFAVVCLDAENDGDLDVIVVGRGLSGSTVLYENDGTGTFVDASSRLPAIDTEWITPFDADDDGDPDLVASRWNAPSRLFVNRLRQVEAPYLARLGQLFVVDLHAVDGTQTRNALWALGPVLDPGLPFLTWGTLRLDFPRLLYTAPIVAIPPGGLPARLAFPVPADPSLLGFPLGIQPLFEAPPPAGWRLGNLLRERVGR